MDQVRHEARLRQFLGWDILVNLATVPCLFVLFALFPNLFFAVLGLGVLGNAFVLIWARSQVERGHLERAVFATCIGLWLIAAAVGVAAPVTLPFVTLLLIWPVALALPYFRGRPLRWVMIVSTAVSIALTLWSGRPDPFQVEAMLPAELVRAAILICVPLAMPV